MNCPKCNGAGPTDGDLGHIYSSLESLRQVITSLNENGALNETSAGLAWMAVVERYNALDPEEAQYEWEFERLWDATIYLERAFVAQFGAHASWPPGLDSAWKSVCDAMVAESVNTINVLRAKGYEVTV